MIVLHSSRGLRLRSFSSTKHSEFDFAHWHLLWFNLPNNDMLECNSDSKSDMKRGSIHCSDAIHDCS